jgi:hypothetical protein
VLASSAVDHEFGGVIVRVLASSAVDRGFGGVMDRLYFIYKLYV